MCRRVECPICGRPSWAGCGAHVEQVLRDVPAAERCQGHAPSAKPPRPQLPEARKSWLKTLFGVR
jgi:hypothetical protein